MAKQSYGIAINNIMPLPSPLLQYRFTGRVKDSEDISQIIRGMSVNYVAQTLSLTLNETADVRAIPWILRTIKDPCTIEWDITGSSGEVLGRKIFVNALVVDHSFEQAYHSSDISIHTIEMRYEDVIYAMVVPS